MKEELLVSCENQEFSKYLVLFVLYIGYTIHTYSRRSFQNVINYVLKEQFIDQKKIGIIVTCQQIGYTLSKMIHPVIIDRIYPQLFFSLSLLLPGIFMAIFSFSQSWYSMSLLYAAQGFSLAFVWPSLAKILKMIIPPNAFGMWWSIECTSSNIGAIIGSLISAIISDRFGWRISIKASAAMCVTCACLSYTCFKFLNLHDNSSQNSDSSSSDINSESVVQLTKADYIMNPVLVCNGILFASVYLSRYVISDWYQIYLHELNFNQLTIASFISSMELGGTIGSICAGISADLCLVKFPLAKNPRLYITIICGVFISMIEYLLTFFVVKAMPKYTLMILGFVFGFFLYGPVSISGIIAIEAAPLERQGLCYSINVLYANLAMLLAGYPISFLGTKLGWKIVLIICLLSTIVSTCLVFLIRNSDTPIDKMCKKKPRSLTVTQSITEWCVYK